MSLNIEINQSYPFLLGVKPKELPLNSEDNTPQPDLPLESGSELGPLVLPSARKLLNFSSDGGWNVFFLNANSIGSRPICGLYACSTLRLESSESFFFLLGPWWILPMIAITQWKCLPETTYRRRRSYLWTTWGIWEWVRRIRKTDWLVGEEGIQVR